VRSSWGVTLESLIQRAKADEYGRLVVPGGSLPLFAATIATHRRALLVLDALRKVLASRGHTVKLRRETGESGPKARLVFAVGGSVIEAAVAERLDRRERPLSKDEEARAAFRAKPDGKGPPPIYEQFASGSGKGLPRHARRGSRTICRSSLPSKLPARWETSRRLLKRSWAIVPPRRHGQRLLRNRLEAREGLPAGDSVSTPSPGEIDVVWRGRKWTTSDC
jgi:hypothetical protein